MPRRSKSGGTAPTIRGAEAKGASKETTQWIYPNIQPSEHDKKLLLEACLAVGVKETFQSHLYTFGGLIYQQLVGGAIGLRLTSVVARIRMARWVRVVIFHLKTAGVTI